MGLQLPNPDDENKFRPDRADLSLAAAPPVWLRNWNYIVYCIFEV
jgi:hypothetical protein